MVAAAAAISPSLTLGRAAQADQPVLQRANHPPGLLMASWIPDGLNIWLTAGYQLDTRRTSWMHVGYRDGVWVGACMAGHQIRAEYLASLAPVGHLAELWLDNCRTALVTIKVCFKNQV